MTEKNWHWFQHLPESGNPPQFQYLLSAVVERDKVKQELETWEENVKSAESQIQALAELKWTEEEILEAKRKLGIVPRKRYTYTTQTKGGVGIKGIYEEYDCGGKPCWRLVQYQVTGCSPSKVHGNRKKPVMGLPPRLDAVPSTGTWVEMESKT